MRIGLVYNVIRLRWYLWIDNEVTICEDRLFIARTVRKLNFARSTEGGRFVYSNVEGGLL